MAPKKPLQKGTHPLKRGNLQKKALPKAKAKSASSKVKKHTLKNAKLRKKNL